jgi:hypothetical protein
MLLSDWFNRAASRAAWTAGNKSAGKMSPQQRSETEPVVIPAIAKPLPPTRPPLLPIFTSAMIPRIIAGRAVKIQNTNPRTPSTKLVIAMPLVCWG